MTDHVVIDIRSSLRRSNNVSSRNIELAEKPQSNAKELRIRRAASVKKSAGRRLLESLSKKADFGRRKPRGPTPTIAVNQRGPQELELSVKLPVDWENVASTEEYEVQLYYFQPQNLASVDTNFYGDIVRMLSFKAPERSLSDLGGSTGAAQDQSAPVVPYASRSSKGERVDETERDRIFRKLKEELQALERVQGNPKQVNQKERKTLVDMIGNRIRTLGCLYHDALMHDTKQGLEILADLISLRKEEVRQQAAKLALGQSTHAKDGLVGGGRQSRPSSPIPAGGRPSTDRRRTVSGNGSTARPGSMTRVSIPRPGGPVLDSAYQSPAASDGVQGAAAAAATIVQNSPKNQTARPSSPVPLPCPGNRGGVGSEGLESDSRESVSVLNGDLTGRLSLDGDIGEIELDEWLTELIDLVEDFASAIEAALTRLQDVGPLLSARWVPMEVQILWEHCEEFVLCVTEDACLRYMSKLEGSFPGLGYPPQIRDALCEPFVNLTLTVRRAKMSAGYEGELLEGHDQGNEAYNTRIHRLRSMMNAVFALEHVTKVPSALLADFIGGMVAALAMFVATMFAFLGQKRLHLSIYSRNFIIIVICAYILKDRIKIWGQRYYAYVVRKMGVMVPDHHIVLKDILGHFVGSVVEECQQKTSAQIPEEIIKLRNAHLPADTRLIEGTMAHEKVVVYKKAIVLNWESLEPTVQEVSGVSDRTRISLAPLLQRTEAPTEPRYVLVDRSRPLGGLSALQKPDLGASVTSYGSAASFYSLTDRGHHSNSTRPPIQASLSAANLLAQARPFQNLGIPEGPAAPLSQASEFVTVKRIPCPRVYECAFVITVRRKHSLGDKLKSGVQAGIGKIFKRINTRARKLKRAMTSLGRMASRSSRSHRSQLDPNSVEVTKCFRVIMDQTGVKRIIEVDGRRGECLVPIVVSMDEDE